LSLISATTGLGICTPPLLNKQNIYGGSNDQK
jgi:hypothetical protein